MLIKGTLSKNTLVTELGEFKVSRKGDSQIVGIFDIETIKGESVEETVMVNGMSYKIQVPVTKAKINAIYTPLTKESLEDEPEQSPVKNDSQAKEDPQATKDLYLGNLTLLDNAHLDKERALFGKPLEELDEYKIDPGLDRDLQTKMKNMLLKSQQFYFRIHDQVWIRK